MVLSRISKRIFTTLINLSGISQFVCLHGDRFYLSPSQLNQYNGLIIVIPARVRVYVSARCQGTLRQDDSQQSSLGRVNIFDWFSNAGWQELVKIIRAIIWIPSFWTLNALKYVFFAQTDHKTTFLDGCW